jgi:hypothetical protein
MGISEVGGLNMTGFVVTFQLKSFYKDGHDDKARITTKEFAPDD